MRQTQWIWRTSSYSVNSSGQCVEVGWRTSSYSANGNSKCVEAGPTLGGARSYAIRDSKNRDAGAFYLSRTEWTVFLTAVKREEL
ncbi:DUF397 domain-containing protein [Marinactinospora rubrisoli]|uniref:DUF397 domain-containing protein n=1 Tax=Marinactinospora rubrisoli TaxID=2715399 RepID=A0ABW2KG28_9ACTN